MITRDEPLLRAQTAGELLVVATHHEDEVVRRFANAAALVAAEHGTERARGWLMGIWYIGGHRHASDDQPTTYWDIVRALQVPLGITIVTA